MEIGIAGKQLFECKYNFDLENISKAGFTALDYGEFINNRSFIYSLNNDEFKKYLTELREDCLKKHIVINQLHSLWIWPMGELDKEENLFNETYKYYVRAIEGAAIFKCKYVVLHPRMPWPYEELRKHEKEARDINIRFLKMLLPYAHQYNVTLCLENMPFDLKYTQFEEIVNQVNEINDNHLGVCLDTGHFNLYNNGYSIYDAVNKMGDRLKALHCHDNKGDSDYHLLPKEGTFDWQSFNKALKNINFQGVFSLETYPHSNELSELKKLYQTVANIINEKE